MNFFQLLFPRLTPLPPKPLPKKKDRKLKLESQNNFYQWHCGMTSESILVFGEQKDKEDDKVNQHHRSCSSLTRCRRVCERESAPVLRL